MLCTFEYLTGNCETRNIVDWITLKISNEIIGLVSLKTGITIKIREIL